MQARVHFHGIAALVGTALLTFSGVANAKVQPKGQLECIVDLTGRISFRTCYLRTTLRSPTTPNRPRVPRKSTSGTGWKVILSMKATIGGNETDSESKPQKKPDSSPAKSYRLCSAHDLRDASLPCAKEGVGRWGTCEEGRGPAELYKILNQRRR